MYRIEVDDLSRPEVLRGPQLVGRQLRARGRQRVDESGVDLSTRGSTDLARTATAGDIGEEDPNLSGLAR